MRKLVLNNGIAYIDPKEIAAILPINGIVCETRNMQTEILFKNGKTYVLYLPIAVIARELGFEKGEF